MLKNHRLFLNGTDFSTPQQQLSATIAVEYIMALPAYSEESIYGVRGKGKRSDETVDLKIISRFTLNRGSKRLSVRTRLDNNVKNHRLRVAFPIGIDTGFADAAGHFTVDRRQKINQPAVDGRSRRRRTKTISPLNLVQTKSLRLKWNTWNIMDSN